MKLKLILSVLFVSLLTYSWAAEPNSPTSFPAAKSTDPMMLIWPSVKGGAKGPGGVDQPSTYPFKKKVQQKKLVKKVKYKSPSSRSSKIKAYKAVKLGFLLVDMSEDRVIPPVIIGNPNESVWYNRVTMSVPLKHDPKVLESLAELYGFMITENKHGMIVLSAKTKNIKVKFQFVTAYNALRAILKDSTIDYIISPSIVKMKKSMTFNLTDYSVHNALYAVAEAFDLKIKKGKGGVLIIEPRHIKSVKTKKLKKKKKSKKHSKHKSK
ncbi:MAG: hypothetical protein KC646_07465 [Candidatus Cloacimonetes bacterium]|nr:hypothetical protein [Candidatus Cloacimonadota bacterium]